MILAERFLAQNAVAPIRDSQDWKITSEHQKKEAMKKKRGDCEKLLAQEKNLTASETRRGKSCFTGTS